MKIPVHISILFCSFAICSNTENQNQTNTDSFHISEDDFDFLLSTNFHDLTNIPSTPATPSTLATPSTPVTLATPSTVSTPAIPSNSSAVFTPLGAPKGILNFTLPFAPPRSAVAPAATPSTPFFKVLPSFVKSSNTIESPPAKSQSFTDRRILPSPSSSPVIGPSSLEGRRILPSPAASIPGQSSAERRILPAPSSSPVVGPSSLEGRRIVLSPAASMPVPSSAERRILPSPITPSTPDLTFLEASTPSFYLPSPSFLTSPQNIPSPRPLISPAPIVPSIQSSEKRAAPHPAKGQPPAKVAKTNEKSTLSQPPVHQVSRDFTQPDSSTVYEIYDPPIPEFIRGENEDIIEARLRYAFELSQLVLDPGFPYLSQCHRYYQAIEDVVSNVRCSWTRHFYLRFFELLSYLLYLIDSSIDRSSCESILNSPIAMQTEYRKVYANSHLSFSKATNELDKEYKKFYLFAHKLLNNSVSLPLSREFLPPILEGIHILQQMEILQFNHFNEKKNILDFCLEAMRKMKADKANLSNAYFNRVDKFSISSRYADMNATLRECNEINKVLQEMSKADDGCRLAVQIIKSGEISLDSLSLMDQTLRHLGNIYHTMLERQKFYSLRTSNFIGLAKERKNFLADVVFAAQEYCWSKDAHSYYIDEINKAKKNIGKWRRRILEFETEVNNWLLLR